MAIKPVLRMGDARLWQLAEPVSDFACGALHDLLNDMHDTMRALNGAGLAAPQIGVALRVVIFGVQPSLDGDEKVNPRYPDADSVPPTVLINPVITPLDSQMEDGWEGCLSVPGLRGLVPRFGKIHYHGYDENGAVIERVASGFHARVVQHECDHLDGILYPMRMADMRKFGYTDLLFPGREVQDE
jgi:peptide deformylase